jgi:putative (di)nucleoside polyphosphate hydrolase
MRNASRLLYRPSVGVMLLNARGEAFVGRRADRPGVAEGGGKWWQMPQGGTDEGEALEAAARRELEEETGVHSARFIAQTRDWLFYDLPSELVGVAWQGRYRGQKQMWFAARFEGDESEIDLSARPGHEPEFDAWRWVPVSELPDLVVPFKREVYARILKEFEPILQEAG